MSKSKTNKKETLEFHTLKYLNSFSTSDVSEIFSKAMSVNETHYKKQCSVQVEEEKYIKLQDIFLVHIIPVQYLSKQNEQHFCESHLMIAPLSSNAMQIGDTEIKLPIISRHTIHFSVNHSVQAHALYSEHSRDLAVIIIPLKDFISHNPGKLYGGYLEDVFAIGKVIIPKSSTIIAQNFSENLFSSLENKGYNTVEVTKSEKGIGGNIKDWFECNNHPYLNVKQSDEQIYAAYSANKSHYLDTQYLIKTITNQKGSEQAKFCVHGDSDFIILEQVVSGIIKSLAVYGSDIINFPSTCETISAKIKHLGISDYTMGLKKILDFISRFKVDRENIEKLFEVCAEQGLIYKMQDITVVQISELAIEAQAMKDTINSCFDDILSKTKEIQSISNIASQGDKAKVYKTMLSFAPKSESGAVELTYHLNIIENMTKGMIGESYAIQEEY